MLMFVAALLTKECRGALVVYIIFLIFFLNGSPGSVGKIEDRTQELTGMIQTLCIQDA